MYHTWYAQMTSPECPCGQGSDRGAGAGKPPDKRDRAAVQGPTCGSSTVLEQLRSVCHCQPQSCCTLGVAVDHVHRGAAGTASVSTRAGTLSGFSAAGCGGVL